ncbi:MAG TPA: hypothetical protein VFG72_01395 [Marmoricola sp.]|nr:hypothetical protein [Marmoricola sp.]
MTDDDFGLDPQVEEAARQPMDDTDEALLDELAQLLTDIDPVPDDLVGRIQFSVALDELYAEVAELTRMPADALAVRHEPMAGERTESLTFSAERLTAMVTVTRADDELRMDGWVAPAQRFLVRVRMQDGQREVETDETGRFVLERLPEGFAQLSFHRVGDDGTPDDADAVVTPLFQL